MSHEAEDRFEGLAEAKVKGRGHTRLKIDLKAWRTKGQRSRSHEAEDRF